MTSNKPAAHRHDDVLHSAPLAFKQRMAGQLRAGHAAWMAEGDGACRAIVVPVAPSGAAFDRTLDQLKVAPAAAMRVISSAGVYAATPPAWRLVAKRRMIHSTLNSPS